MNACMYTDIRVAHVSRACVNECMHAHLSHCCCSKTIDIIYKSRNIDFSNCCWPKVSIRVGLVIIPFSPTHRFLMNDVVVMPLPTPRHARAGLMISLIFLVLVLAFRPYCTDSLNRCVLFKLFKYPFLYSISHHGPQNYESWVVISFQMHLYHFLCSLVFSSATE